MVPISLAIGLFLPLPFYLGVRPRVFPPPDAIADMFTVPPLAEGRLPEPQHVHHSAVLVLHVRRREHTDQHVHSARDPLPVVGAHALPALVHEVQLHRRRGARRRHPDHRLHPQLCPVRRRGQCRRLPELVGQRPQPVCGQVSCACLSGLSVVDTALREHRAGFQVPFLLW